MHLTAFWVQNRELDRACTEANVCKTPAAMEMETCTDYELVRAGEAR